MTQIIQVVSDNTDKFNTYKKYKEKFKLAIEHEFYLEAIMIDYAMIEDRMRSLLYYLGITSEAKGKPSISKLCRSTIRELLGYKPNATIRLHNISVKRKILQRISELTAEELSAISPERARLYFVRVQNALHAYSDDTSLSLLLGDVEEWCERRNQYVHALLNKNYNALQDGLLDFVKKGKDIANGLHNIVRFVKPSNAEKPRKRIYNIRKEFKIQ